MLTWCLLALSTYCLFCFPASSTSPHISTLLLPSFLSALKILSSYWSVSFWLNQSKWHTLTMYKKITLQQDSVFPDVQQHLVNVKVCVGTANSQEAFRWWWKTQVRPRGRVGPRVWMLSFPWWEAVPTWAQPTVAAKVRSAMMRGNKAEVTEGQRPTPWWEGEGQRYGLREAEESML